MIDGGLRGIITKKIPRAHWQAIESGATGGGIPDLNGCIEGTEVWIECKLTNAFSVSFRPGQPAWIDRRYRAGGRIWVAIRQTRRVSMGGDDNIWLVSGAYVRVLVVQGLKIPDGMVAGRWSGGPTKWDWSAILAVLLGPTAPPAAGSRE